MSRKIVRLLIVGAALVILAWIFLPALSKYHTLRSHNEELTEALAQLKAQVAALEKEIDLLEHDTAYIEKIAREELGFVKPSETVYRFSPQVATQKEGVES